MFQLAVVFFVIMINFSAILFLGTPLMFFFPLSGPVPAQLPAQGPVPALVLAVAQAPLLPRVALGAPAPHAVPVPAALLDPPAHLDGDTTTGDVPVPSQFCLTFRNYQIAG